MKRRKNKSIKGKLKKANRKLIYIAIVTILLIALLFATLMIQGAFQSNLAVKGNSQELDKYRSETIPEECRLPEYKDNVDSWKAHLSHHENTLYCLKYYE